MDAEKCKYCGGDLVLVVTPDYSNYEKAMELLPKAKADARFIGEIYSYKCPRCGRTGMAKHRDNVPDMAGRVQTPEEAKAIALWFFENLPR